MKNTEIESRINKILDRLTETELIRMYDVVEGEGYYGLINFPNRLNKLLKEENIENVSMSDAVLLSDVLMTRIIEKAEDIL